MIEWVETAEHIAMLDLARLEFMSVLQRRFRNKELTNADMTILLDGFQERWLTYQIQPINHKVVDEAEKFLLTYGDRFGLRTLDALHAAAFALIAEKDWHFVAADRNLCQVITELGFSVLNPLES